MGSKNGGRIARVLIANRGEIAVRIARAIREEGMESVAVFSEVDAGAEHTRAADQRVGLPGKSAKESYLNGDRLIAAALQSGATAVHPGYGFLAENAHFAHAVRKAGLIFIGPNPKTIELMGDKDLARQSAGEHGVPIIPGTRAGLTLDELKKFCGKVGYPVMVKAVAGGSGRGMRVVEREEDLAALVREAEAEAKSAFGNPAVIIEKLLIRPRHIEVQLFGDSSGAVLHFGERDCSVQRRQQKIIEEAPAPRFHPVVRERMLAAAVGLARGVGYLGAGTMEFLVEGGEDPDSPFYFLEMNTRIQVEHPVTEAITGVDLVRMQLRVAFGEHLSFRQDAVRFSGHAMQFRVYAEDPTAGFRPATGTVRWISRATGPGVREDSWVEPGTVISPYYDSLLAKLVIWGGSRSEVIARSRAVLDGYLVEGMPTTLDFHRWILTQEAFFNGALDVKWIEREYKGEVCGARTVGPVVLPSPRPEL